MTEQVRRAARLSRMEQKLRANPQGLTVRELAGMLGSSVRTIQRDINVIDLEMGVPLLQDGRRWKLMPGSTPIGAVRFNLQEARAVLLATRLYFRHADRLDPDALAALQKLADALPPMLAANVESTIAQLRRRAPEDRTALGVLRTLTDAWAGSRTVRIRYRSQRTRATEETDLDPYVIEPTTAVAATYVIGYSSRHQEVRTFKIDRLVSAELTDRSFVASDVRGLLDQISQSWGVVFAGDEEKRVVIRFSGSAADRVRETNWHASQRIVELERGVVELELVLPSLLDFIPWVRGWGHEAVVIEPPDLRDAIAASFRTAAEQYQS
jgi:proteasome accessory factor B